MFRTRNDCLKAPLALLLSIMMVTCALPLCIAGGAAHKEAPSRALPTDPKYVILTSITAPDPYYQAVSVLRNLRGGNDVQVINFDPKLLDNLLPALRSAQPRYAAVIVKPTELDINFVRAFLVMSTKVDNDPFTDFSYGFITGATAGDALNFVNNIKKAETQKVQDWPLNWSGFSASSINAVYTSPFGNTDKALTLQKFSMIYMKENDTGTGLQHFLTNDHYITDNKILDIGNNGDPHMIWLFEGGNINPNPASWPYNTSRIEDPAYARVGLTSKNISNYNLFPAVVFNGACHQGETKRVMVSGDIEATFGDTGGVRRFYNMSDDYSFALQILKTNLTGYFAAVGANTANQKDEEVYNAFLYDMPLGDVAKMSNDIITMGFLGNRPNVSLYSEGESEFKQDIGPSGTYDPADWSGLPSIMLSGKSNRVYFGDPLYDPYKNDHTSKLQWTTTTLTPIDKTHIKVDLNTDKPAGYTPTYIDMFHYQKTRIYVPVAMPGPFGNITDVKVIGASAPMTQAIHAVENLDNKTVLHLEVDIANDSMTAVKFNVTFMVTVREPPTYNVEILGSDIKGTAYPFFNKSYTVPVKNTGNIVDQVMLSHSSMPPGWGAEVIFNGTDMVPGETRDAKVNISIPPNALAGDNATIQLTAMSFGNMSRHDRLNITTTVLAYHGVDIFGMRLTGWVRPGETKDFLIQISNAGNAEDWFLLNITDKVGTAAVVLQNETLHMAPKGMANAIVSVTPQADAPAESNTSMTLKVTSQANSSRNDTIVIAAFVNPIFKVNMTVSGAKTITNHTAPGVAWKAQLRVADVGNALDTFELKATAAPHGWTVDIDLTNLAPGLSKVAWANVTIKPRGNMLANEEMTVNITAISQGNTSVTDTVQIRTIVSAVPSIRLDAPDNRNAVPGARFIYNFTVNNTGNAKDTYRIEASSGRAWSTAIGGGNRTKPISPNGNATISIELIVPPKTVAGTVDTLTVKVTSTNFTTTLANATVKTTVSPVYLLGIIMLKLSATIHANETATFTITVLNRGNTNVVVTMTVASEGYNLPWANLTAYNFGLDAYTERVLVFSVSPSPNAKAGNYTYTVTAKSQDSTQAVDLKVTVLKTKHEDKNFFARTLLTLGLLLMLIVAVVAFYLSRKREDDAMARKGGVRKGKDAVVDRSEEE